jgi:hypothetical protein
VADIADGEGNVQSHVYEVPEAADQASVLSGVHWWSNAVLGQLQMVLHESMTGVAVPHPSTLQNLACVRRLFQLDAVAPLLHLDAQIETQ